MDSQKADMFKVLGVESRIKIIDLLKAKGSLGVNQMAESLGITPSAVSQHLKVLKHAGLVKSERKGYWIPYSLDTEALECCGQLLSEVCNCGCNASGPMVQAEIDMPHSVGQDTLADLKRYQDRLNKELKAVAARIAELGIEG